MIVGMFIMLNLNMVRLKLLRIRTIVFFNGKKCKKQNQQMIVENNIELLS
jgi:hypothetical protein